MADITSKKKAIKVLYKSCSSIITERTQEIHRLVEGSGSLDSKVVFIAYMPTDIEEEEGATFYGKTGTVFQEILSSIDLKLEEIYITELIKYKPYKVNERTGRIIKRDVTEDEKKFFLEYILKELEIIKPDFVVPLGQDVLRIFMEDEHIMLEQTRGKLLTKDFGNSKYRLLPMHDPNDKNQTIEKDIEVIRTLWDHMNRDERHAQEVEKKKYNIAPKKKQMTKSEGKASQKDQKKILEDNRIKVIIVNGSTGYTDDPTAEVIHRISHVLAELNTNIIRLDLANEYNIKHFLEEVATADGVILATTVTWFGIGGRMQLFLDDCYAFGNQAIFGRCYLMGVVISKQMYERDAYHHMIRSWEILGGIEGTHLCASIKNVVTFETDKALGLSVDKKAEEFYRIINQKRTPLPSSIRSNKIYIEVEQSHINPVSDNEVEIINHKPSTLIPNYDAYMEKQKKDIEDISELFKKKINKNTEEASLNEPERFMTSFTKKEQDLSASIQWIIDDHPSKNFNMVFTSGQLRCRYGELPENNVYINLEYDILRKILNGKLTIQRAFMTGMVKAKGDFTLLYKLDQMFTLDET
ncbi:MAG: SCP2 sterol-binding domain-containing protein [Vallitaleaceae bacterium]|jgi:uracil-DNA glycosylase family 4|nr:SCP2 sterol-binding domain-containing protein [Vallitaleaceae bacterium]